MSENTKYVYTIGAYIKSFESWRVELTKKHGAIPDLTSELLEGEAQITQAMAQTKGADRTALAQFKDQWNQAPDQEARVRIALDPQLSTLMEKYESRAAWTIYGHELEIIVDRERARYGAWYEIFPRSEGTIEGKGGTFKDCEVRLPIIREMGFDVLYLTPIHPIGEINRKGRNNSLEANPEDPGSPWAIGSRHGGHDAIEPALGTLEDFARFQEAVRQHDMELALDFAINTAPDHPYVQTHPEWFKHRPDGTIKYAENPPKKYEDIYALDFYSKAWQEIWERNAPHLAFLDRSRGQNLSSRQSPYETRSVLGMAYWQSPTRTSGGDIFIRSVHQAQNDESPRQSRIHAILYLLHLAKYQTGDDGIPHRTHPN